MFWINPSAKYLKKYLAENPVDVIVSTGPPHSMHLIAKKVHESTGIPWIADFRDPWTNIDFYKDLRLTSWADKKQHRLELEVLQAATKVVAVTWKSRDEFKEISGRNDIEVVPNGFDDADFPPIPADQLDKDFTIVHVGSMNKDRNPEVLWKAVKAAIAQSPSLTESIKIRLIGPVDFSVRVSVQDAGLQSLTSFIDYVPHTEAVKLQQQAQVNLLVVNISPTAWTIIPGKFYEYLGSGRPFIALTPQDSDTAKVLEQTKGGVVHEYDDVEGLKNRILEYFALYQAGNLKIDSQGTEQFTRKHLAGEFAKVLDKTVIISQG